MEGRKGYIFDLDAICDFVFDSQANRSINTEIQQEFKPNGENEVTLAKKSITETKKEDSHKADIKYDIVKSLLETFGEITIEDDSETPVIDTLNQRIAFNTLFAHEFIKEIVIK